MDKLLIPTNASHGVASRGRLTGSISLVSDTESQPPDEIVYPIGKARRVQPESWVLSRGSRKQWSFARFQCKIGFVQ